MAATGRDSPPEHPCGLFFFLSGPLSVRKYSPGGPGDGTSPGGSGEVKPNPKSVEASALRHPVAGSDQHHLALLVRHAEHEDLGHGLADLARREVHHRQHLAPD